ncbi:hypothetical protein GW17_00027314 [Ensete ventricosum]|nr:hypothetical protein GW17_00027314 [Ensete ventricosum]
MAMGLAAPWYRRCGTSVELSIPCSHGGRVLVVKGVEEVENAKANSKYQDRAKGQKSRNFIRPPSNLAFLTTKRMGEVEYPNSRTYPVEELYISSPTPDLHQHLFDYNFQSLGMKRTPVTTAISQLLADCCSSPPTQPCYSFHSGREQYLSLVRKDHNPANQ